MKKYFVVFRDVYNRISEEALLTLDECRQEFKGSVIQLIKESSFKTLTIQSNDEKSFTISIKNDEQ